MKKAKPSKGSPARRPPRTTKKRQSSSNTTARKKTPRAEPAKLLRHQRRRIASKKRQLVIEALVRLAGRQARPLEELIAAIDVPEIDVAAFFERAFALAKDTLEAHATDIIDANEAARLATDLEQVPVSQIPIVKVQRASFVGKSRQTAGEASHKEQLTLLRLCTERGRLTVDQGRQLKRLKASVAFWKQLRRNKKRLLRRLEAADVSAGLTLSSLVETIEVDPIDVPALLTLVLGEDCPSIKQLETFVYDEALRRRLLRALPGWPLDDIPTLTPSQLLSAADIADLRRVLSDTECR